MFCGCRCTNVDVNSDWRLRQTAGASSSRWYQKEKPLTGWEERVVHLQTGLVIFLMGSINNNQLKEWDDQLFVA